MRVFAELEFRGYEEKPYNMAQGNRVISGISKSLTFLDESMQVVKVAIPKDSTLDISSLKEKETYSVELEVKMQPVVDQTTRVVSNKQFNVYFQILNVLPWSLNNKPSEASAPVQGTAPVQENDKKKDKEKTMEKKCSEFSIVISNKGGSMHTVVFGEKTDIQENLQELMDNFFCLLAKSGVTPDRILDIMDTTVSEYLGTFGFVDAEEVEVIKLYNMLKERGLISE